MNWSATLFSALAAGAGCCIALQASANGRLRQNLAAGATEGSADLVGPAWASAFSIAGTVLCAGLALLVLRPAFPTKEAFQSTQWWNWVGGPLGALIVLAGAALAPRLGAAAFIALVVGGQLVCSMLLDHFGLMGLKPRPMDVGRVVGAVLVVVGVVLVNVKWDDIWPPSAPTPPQP